MDAFTKAKVQMIVSSPFFATLALSMTYVEDNSIPTACTDGKEIRYNPEFVRSLQKEEVVALLVHELLHVAYLHHVRIKNREPQRFNVAADYAINPIVEQSGFTLPNGALLSSDYADKSAEEIYNLLPESIPQPMGMVKQGENTAEEEARVKMLVAKAANAARAQGKLPSTLQRLVSEVVEPKKNWREVLVRFLTEKVKSDYSWRFPNKRYLPSYLPSIDSVPVLGEIVLVVDTSGSIDNFTLTEFASEIEEICRMMNKPLLVLYVDSEVAGSQTFEPNDTIALNPMGGGGTDFKPGFKYLENNNIEPICLIYFTDGQCNSFPIEPLYPVLWTIYNYKNFNPPFGETINL